MEISASNPSRPIQGGASLIVGLQLKGKHVLVVGGGKEAASRCFFALDADALVTVVSPLLELHQGVRKRMHMLNFVNRKFMKLIKRQVHQLSKVTFNHEVFSDQPAHHIAHGAELA